MAFNWTEPHPDQIYLDELKKRDAGEWEIHCIRYMNSPWRYQGAWQLRAPDGRLLGLTAFTPTRSTAAEIREWVENHVPKAFESIESVERRPPNWPTSKPSPTDLKSKVQETP